MIRRRLWPSRRDADRGFTLIELIVTVVILGIITVPLGNFMLAYLRNQVDTKDRISDSHDMQIATAYFSQDVASMGLRADTDPYGFTASAWRPSDATLPSPYCGQGSGTLVLLLKWTSWSVTNGPTGSRTVAAAAYVNESGVLHRLYCSDATNGTTLKSDATLVHNLAGATGSCPGGRCDTDTPPATVSLNLTIASTGDRAAPDPVTLTGQRRQS